MSAETLEQWTPARAATTLDWPAFRRVFLDDEERTGDVEAMERAGLLAVDHSERSWSGGLCWSADIGRVDAVQAYRDRVADGLIDSSGRFVGWCSPWTYHHVRKIGLYEDGLAPGPTNFGHEIARVLRERGDR